MPGRNSWCCWLRQSDGLKDQNGDVIAGERRIFAFDRRGEAGSDGSFFVAARGDAAGELVGEFGKTAALPAHHEVVDFGAGGDAGVLAATGAHGGGEVGVRDDGDAALNEEICNFSFDLFGGEHGDGFGVVGHGVQAVRGIDDSDADGVDVGIDEIGVVMFGVHPLVVDGLWQWGDGDILFNEREVDAGGGGAGGEVWLAGKLMGDGVLGGDALGVKACSNREGGVPLERRQVQLGPRLVCEVDKALLSGAGSDGDAGKGLRG